MRSLYMALALLLSSAATADAGSDFCAGFEHGYIIGYKRASGSGYDPYTPYCPYQPYKKLGDPDSDFEHGCLIGLEDGLHEGRN